MITLLNDAKEELSYYKDLQKIDIIDERLKKSLDTYVKDLHFIGN